MLFEDAQVHYHGETSLARFFGRGVIYYAFLHPDGARADTNRGVDYFGYLFRSPEDIDDINRGSFGIDSRSG